MLDLLRHEDKLSTSEIAKFWNVTTRTARTRLKKIVEKGIINHVATSIKDPYAVFKLPNR